MMRPPPRKGLACAVLAAAVAAASPALAFDRNEYRSAREPRDLEELRGSAPESNGFLEYMRDRTKFGLGAEEVFTDNFFLQDNAKRSEYTSILEGEVFFADPRGDLLYGLDYEANAYRYHRANANTVDHDFNAFLDYDPGGRTKLGLDYKLVRHSFLVFGLDEVDVIRRTGSDFQTIAEHRVTQSAKYALNETNSLVEEARYNNYDYQAVDDAGGDFIRWEGALDLDHDLRPDWTVYGGYQYTVVDVRDSAPKNSTSNALRLGTRYELTDVSSLDALFRIGRREFDDGVSSTTTEFEGKWQYELSPRTRLLLAYFNTQEVSLQVGRRSFRSNRPSSSIEYALTPLIAATFGISYERQTSGSEEAVPGFPATKTVSSLYNINLGMHWQLREQTRLFLDYRYSRAKEADITSNLVTAHVQTTF